jgi:pyruvate, orthophosphate dikinase
MSSTILGLCGAHGGEPSSIGFCHATRFDFVSCSPYSVPIAKLAAGHVALCKIVRDK